MKARAAQKRSTKRNQRWDKARILDEIRDLHRRGKSLASSKVSLKLRESAKYHFGSWRGAVELAGVDYEEQLLHRSAIPTLELLRRLRRAARLRQSGADARSVRSVLSKEIIQAAVNRFGTLRRAFVAAGVDPARAMLRRTFTREQVGAELGQLAQQKPLMTITELQETPVGRAARVRYGSVRAALEAVGIQGWPQQMQALGRSARGVDRAGLTGETITSGIIRELLADARRAAEPDFALCLCCVTALRAPATLTTEATRRQWQDARQACADAINERAWQWMTHRIDTETRWIGATALARRRGRLPDGYEDLAPSARMRRRGGGRRR